ncbi:hypothetical protein BsWGS_05103 [Bradybaena similaris]
MAAETGIPSVYLEHQLSHGRASKKTQGSVIDKLRHRNSQARTWNDSIKSVRGFVTERKTQPEKTEASGVQECLDTLQKAMKVISQETLKERLDLIGRQLGLNTEVQDDKVSLGTDVFHVEVLLGDEGTIANVKLANQGEVVECPALKEILIKGDFPEFIEHLQGLQSIYQVTSDEKLQSKAFLALQALEKDLNQLAQFQSSISGVANYIHKCPLGIMLPRLAGKPMKLIYFVSPYDLLDKKSLTAHPLTVEAITENFLGQSVTVCIESVPDLAPANKLQTMPLMNVSKTQDGKSKINSMLLPASFVLVLPQSIPVSLHILHKITAQTGLDIPVVAEPQSLCSLVLEAFSGGAIKDCRELYVRNLLFLLQSLPDQQHIYFLDSLNGQSPDQQGVMVSRIPFTHPTHVPQVLNLMRQQLLFNIVIASCIRPDARKDNVNCIVFEVTAVSLHQLTIVFEHPAYDSMVTVDIDLSDITNLKCRVSGTNPEQELCSDEAVSRVFQRSMSIPVMLRWLITKGRAHLNKLKEAALAAERERLEKALFLKEMQQRQAKLQPTTLPANRPPPQPPHPPPLPPPPSYLHLHSPMHIPQGQLGGNGQTQGMHPALVEARTTMPGLDDFGHVAESNNKHPNERLMSMDDEHAHNPLLSTLLDEEKLSRAGSQADLHDSPMLSRLLDDNTSVATTVIPMNCKITPSVSAKRIRKRKMTSDFGGPSPKHRVSDMDPTDHMSMLGSSMDLDVGATLIDQGLPNTPPVMGSMTPTHGSSSYHHQHTVLNHASKATRLQSNVIDLTEVGLGAESSLKKLADMDKHFIHKDVKTEPDLSMLLNEAENPNRIPNILQNSPSGSKNENASTSLEGYLKGSGEVGRAKDFDPSDASSVHSSNTLSKLSSLLLASSDSPSPLLSAASHKVTASFFSDKLASEEAFACVGKPVSDCGFPQDVKPSPALLRKGSLRQSLSMEIPNDKQITSGLFEKFDIPRQQPAVKTEAANIEIKSHPVEGKVSLKLKVGHFKQQNSMKPYVKSFRSMDEADLVYEKSNSIGTFDFKSDEDDDESSVQLPSDRYVYTSSSSPPGGQISSSKPKQLNDYVPHKSDKTKKKERRSGNITKRKRDKDESKREKKRKKNEHFIQESVYRTVENDTKADFKLKIFVSKKHVSDKSNVLSGGKVQSYEIKKRSLSGSFDKPVTIKQEDKEQEPVVRETVKEKDAVLDGGTSAKSVSSKLSTSVHKSSPKSGSKSLHSSGSSSKTDPKLVTKATIRLKPLMLPSSGSTVNISQTAPKALNSTSGSSKMDRRSSTSVPASASDKRSLSHTSQLERKSSLSSLVDRRSSTQSSQLSSSWSSTSVSTSVAVTSASTVPASLSLSSILPNAPTTSKIASMPRIPKLSSSSSNTSINRTSSLDPAAGSVPTSAGTKSNNSYTVGPAGRPNSGAASGVAGGRSSAGISGMFNYNNRPSTPGSAGNSKPNFNGSRPPGPATTSPLVNSSQAGSQRPSPGPRAHTPSVSGNSHKPAMNSSNSHKTSGNFTSNFVKGTTGSSSSLNVSQKTHGSGAKLNNSISAKTSSNFTAQKSTTGSGNSVSGQRHSTQNAHSGSSMRTGASSSSVSPNTGLTKSPNSGRSPNLTNSSKSPSLNTASKSPNIPAANKSPINSTSSGRSPNINRSPSTNVSAVKPSPSPSHSGKSPVSVSHKHLSSLTKPSGVSKPAAAADALKSHTAASSRRSFSSSGSSKSLPSKTGSKTTLSSSSSSSSNSQQGNGKSISITSSNASSTINSKGSSTSSSVSSSNMSAVDSAQKSLPNDLHASSVTSHKTASVSATDSAHKSLPNDPHASSVTSHKTASLSTPLSSSPSLPLSPVNSNSADHPELNQDIKGSKSVVTGTDSLKAALPEKSPLPVSSTPNAVRCADSVKSMFNFPSCKGRKNSLSAIVDKLKHNAVGSGLDSPGVLATVSDSPNSGGGKTSVSQDAVPDLKQPTASSDVGTEDEKKEFATAKHGASADRVNKKLNHMLENDKVNATSINISDGAVGFSSKCVQSDTSDKLLSVVNCDRSRLAEDRTTNLPDTENGLVRTRLKDSSGSDRDKPFLDIQDSNRASEKPTPLKIPLPVQSFTSSPVQSPAINPCNTSSPQPSPFQPLQSPALIKNSSPLINVYSINDCEQVFKMPSVKSAVDNHSEIEPSETPGTGCETQTKKSEDICVNTPSDNSDISLYVEKKTNKLGKEISSTLMSSPLSDISSPENGLIIDDIDSHHLATKSSTDKLAGSNSVPKTCSPKSSINENNIVNVSVSSPNCAHSIPLVNSPKTSWPSYIKSPTLSKSSSGASALRDSDSPCPIDDDLMDVALGIGS